MTHEHNFLHSIPYAAGLNFLKIWTLQQAYDAANCRFDVPRTNSKAAGQAEGGKRTGHAQTKDPTLYCARYNNAVFCTMELGTLDDSIADMLLCQGSLEVKVAHPFAGHRSSLPDSSLMW